MLNLFLFGTYLGEYGDEWVNARVGMFIHTLKVL